MQAALGLAQLENIDKHIAIKREIGIQIQFQDSGVFKSTYTTKEVTKNQLINYILTNPGERFFNPSFGSGIKSLLFEQTNDLTQLEEQISLGISNNVENIRVNSVSATQNNNEIYINVNYTINNQNDELTLALDINE
jgi:phage baseplate assembly protein W